MKRSGARWKHDDSEDIRPNTTSGSWLSGARSFVLREVGGVSTLPLSLASCEAPC
jgi:hypothetical protein